MLAQAGASFREGTDPCPREGGSPSQAGPPPCGQEPVSKPEAISPGPCAPVHSSASRPPYGASSISEMRCGARQEPSWRHPLGFFFTPEIRKGHPSLTPFFSWSWFKSGPFWPASLLLHPEVGWRPTGSLRQLYSWGSRSEWEV